MVSPTGFYIILCLRSLSTDILLVNLLSSSIEIKVTFGVYCPQEVSLKSLVKDFRKSQGWLLPLQQVLPRLVYSLAVCFGTRTLSSHWGWQFDSDSCHEHWLIITIHMWQYSLGWLQFAPLFHPPPIPLLTCICKSLPHFISEGWRVLLCGSKTARWKAWSTTNWCRLQTSTALVLSAGLKGWQIFA